MAIAAWLKTGSCKRIAAAEDPVEDVEAECSPTTTKKPKFQEKWRTEFDWLRHDEKEGVIFCQICREADLSSRSRKANTNFERTERECVFVCVVLTSKVALHKMATR